MSPTKYQQYVDLQKNVGIVYSACQLKEENLLNMGWFSITINLIYLLSIQISDDCVMDQGLNHM
jgi:hypothetical protein